MINCGYGEYGFRGRIEETGRYFNAKKPHHVGAASKFAPGVGARQFVSTANNSPPSGRAARHAWAMAESCQDPVPAGREKVQYSSNLTGSVLLPSTRTPASSVV